MSATSTSAGTVTVVVPTIGRPSLRATLVPLLGRVPIVVVDDRTDPRPPLELPVEVAVVRSGGRGPAAARNRGWRAVGTDWVAFLDDDVVPPDSWADVLHADLDACAADVGGCAGRIVVPLPTDRRPTDWERNTAGLQTAVWATADLAYRRRTLREVGGFDERFPRAYREDADLGLRVTRAGWRIVTGRRWIHHPVRPAPWNVSVRLQRGNADDVLMRALHGPRWRELAHVPPGRRPWHLVTVTTLAAALAAAATRRPRLAAGAILTWTALTADFAQLRISPGPRTPREVATMVATSAVIPVAATQWWVRGWLTLRRRERSPGPQPQPAPGPAPA